MNIYYKQADGRTRKLTKKDKFYLFMKHGDLAALVTAVSSWRTVKAAEANSFVPIRRRLILVDDGKGSIDVEIQSRFYRHRPNEKREYRWMTENTVLIR